MSAAITSSQSKSVITSQNIDLSNATAVAILYNTNNDPSLKKGFLDVTSISQAYIFVVGYKDGDGYYLLNLCATSTNASYPNVIKSKNIALPTVATTYYIHQIYLIK